jgi:D-serine deaminase-like pyridoxal phosphate-dependent protein
VCQEADIAASVLTEVIGHRQASGEVLVDAGWMALSRDRGRAPGAADRGYGLVRSLDGSSLGEIIVRSSNQEHGIVGHADQTRLNLSEFPIGRRLRILPNHACATAGQHAGFWLHQSNDGSLEWLTRCQGW